MQSAWFVPNATFLAALTAALLGTACAQTSSMLKSAGVPGPLADMAVKAAGNAARPMVHQEMAKLLRGAGLRHPERIIEAAEHAANGRSREAASTIASALAMESLSASQRQSISAVLGPVEVLASTALGPQNEVTQIAAMLRHALANPSTVATAPMAPPAASPQVARAATPAPTQAAATACGADLDYVRMKSRLADSGIRRPELLLRALRNTTRGENGAAALELRAALLANGVVRAVHGGAVTRAFLDAASEQGGSALCAVERALVALVKGSEPEPGQPVLDGLVSQEAYAALQRAKSLEPVQSGTGFVYFDSDVPGADVRIAGRSYGRAPVSADDVPTGYQLVEVAAVGHPVVKAYALVEPLDVTVARVKFGASRELVARGSQPTAATPVLAAQVSSDANSLLNALAPAAQPAPQAGEIPLGTMDLFFRAAPALERLVGYPIVIELSTGDMVEGELKLLLPTDLVLETKGGRLQIFYEKARRVIPVAQTPQPELQLR